MDRYLKKMSSLFCFLCLKSILTLRRSLLSWKLLILQNRPKRHFWPPWPKNARECFAPLCLYTTRPAKTNLKTSARQPDPNSLHNPNGTTRAHKTGFLQETLSYYFVTFLSCCQDESFDVSCSCWWGVTLRGIGWSMSLGRRRTVTCKREVSPLSLYKMSQNVHLQQIWCFSSFQRILNPILIMFTLWIHSGYSENSFYIQNPSILTFHKFECLDRKSHIFS